jgi:hypothetical protein
MWRMRRIPPGCAAAQSVGRLGLYLLLKQLLRAYTELVLYIVPS